MFVDEYDAGFGFGSTIDTGFDFELYGQNGAVIRNDIITFEANVVLELKHDNHITIDVPTKSTIILDDYDL